MQGVRYPYLDLCVWHGLRPFVLSSRPVMLFDAGMESVLWANAAGAEFFGGTGIAEFLETPPSPSQSFVRQLASAAGQLDGDEPLKRGFRLVRGLRTELIQCELSHLLLPDGEHGLLVICEDSQNRRRLNEYDLALSVVDSLEDFADAAAIIDDAGLVIASSNQFDDIELAFEDLETMVEQLQDEADRLVKRPIEAMDGTLFGSGLARLRTRPGRNLLVLLAMDAEETEDEIADTTGDAVAAPIDENEDGIDVELDFESESDFDDENELISSPPITTEDMDDEGEGGTDIEADAGRSLPEGGVMGRARSLLERWYKAENEAEDKDNPFGEDAAASSSDDETDLPADERAEEKPLEPSDADTASPFVFEADLEPVRFAWSTDTDQTFIKVSPELADTVGPAAADVTGRRWRDVARVFGFDESGEIEQLLAREDTWSGKTIWWPVEGTDQLVPIDLAALPAFGAARQFEGFRGFGIIRVKDAITDPVATGLALGGGKQARTDQDEAIDTSNLDANEDEFTQSDEPESFGTLTDDTLDDIDLRDDGDETPKTDASSIGKLGGNIVNMVPRLRGGGRDADLDPLNEREAAAFDRIGETLRDGEDAELAPGDEGPTDDLANDDEPPFRISANDTEEVKEADLVTDAAPEETRISDPDDHGAQETPATPEDDLPWETHRAIIDRLRSPILIYLNGVTFYANQELLELTGYTSVDELARAGGVDAILDMSSFEGESEPGETRLITRDGETIEVQAQLSSVPWDDGRALMLTFTKGGPEIAPAKVIASDTDLGARVQELTDILDTATDGILILREGGKIESINASAKALFGVDDDGVVGKPFHRLFAVESRENLETYFNEISATGSAALINDGREAIGKEARGGLIPLFVTFGKTGNEGRICAVIRDMTAWKKSEEELIANLREARTENQQKSTFLATVSHEIRTPLNAIIGFSDVMIEGRLGPIDNERYREYLKDIRVSGQHVLDLINDLLDLSKIEAGKIDLNFEAVDLNAIVTESVAVMQPEANRNRILIRTSLSRAVPDVVADARSMRQIVLNLVSNAIKFTPENGQVIVSTVYEANGEVTLRIRDTGHGMDEQEIKEAMKPFHQLGKVSDKRGRGTGLGLPLTKALVEANRAYFDLESEPNVGTIAHVQFPVQRVLAD